MLVWSSSGGWRGGNLSVSASPDFGSNLPGTLASSVLIQAAAQGTRAQGPLFWCSAPDAAAPTFLEEFSHRNARTPPLSP